MSLAMAALENTSKLQEGQYDQNTAGTGGVVLDRNGSFAGNDAPILARVDTGAKSSTNNPVVMRQDI